MEKWWADHVDTGISPAYDEKKDAEILTALRTNTLSPDTDITALIREAEALKAEVDKATAAIAVQEKRLKKIGDLMKEFAKGQFRPGDKKIEIKGNTYCWTLARSETTKTVYDDAALRADGVYDKYVSTTQDTSYRMTVSTIKEDK